MPRGDRAAPPPSCNPRRRRQRRAAAQGLPLGVRHRSRRGHRRRLSRLRPAPAPARPRRSPSPTPASSAPNLPVTSVTLERGRRLLRLARRAPADRGRVGARGPRHRRARLALGQRARAQRVQPRPLRRRPTTPAATSSRSSAPIVSDGATFLAPVGAHPEGASPDGVLDMAGNVDGVDRRLLSSPSRRRPSSTSTRAAPTPARCASCAAAPGASRRSSRERPTAKPPPPETRSHRNRLPLRQRRDVGLSRAAVVL